MSENTTVWIATVNTRYEWVAVDTDPEVAIQKACTAALKWLRDAGVTEHRTVADVRRYFDVTAYAVNIGEAVRPDMAPTRWVD